MQIATRDYTCFEENKIFLNFKQLHWTQSNYINVESTSIKNINLVNARLPELANPGARLANALPAFIFSYIQ